MIFYRVDDQLPAVEILVLDAGVPIDLTSLTAYVRWARPDDSVIAERPATTLNALAGQTEFAWQAGDLTIPGLYRAIVQLEPTGSPGVRYSLTSPPLLEIEVLEDDFAHDDTLTFLPRPSGAMVLDILQKGPDQVNTPSLLGCIDRARRGAYVYCEFWRSPGIALSRMDTLILRDLIAYLAAYEYLNEKRLVYGPYSAETIGTYEYKLKDPFKSINPYAKLGIEGIDSIIEYFIKLAKQAGKSIDVIYPDWRQPVVEPILNPVPFQTPGIDL